jgi:hypothetical protein
MLAVSVVGASSSRCSFVSWDTPSPCVKSAEAWPRAKENFGIWGLPSAPARSTLAYANEHRPWQLQRTVFEQLLAKCQILAASQSGTRKKRKFRFKNPLMSLDATVIDLCATMFDWAKFRLTKGAVKLHLLLDHDGYLPSFAVITEGKT